METKVRDICGWRVLVAQMRPWDGVFAILTSKYYSDLTVSNIASYRKMRLKTIHSFWFLSEWCQYKADKYNI